MSKQVSTARLAANRRNAQKSTGPRTAEGKSRSSRNAVTHGLLAESGPGNEPGKPASASSQVLLLLRFTADLHPVGILETTLVDRLASLQQRLDRIRVIESGLLEKTMTNILSHHPEFAQPGQETVMDCLAAPASTLLAEAYGRESRTINLLSFYEARLSRDFHRTLNELRQSQTQRRASEQSAVDKAAPSPNSANATRPAANSATPSTAPLEKEQTNPILAQRITPQPLKAQQDHAASPVQASTDPNQPRPVLLP